MVFLLTIKKVIMNKPNTYTVYQHLTGEPVLANFVKVARYTSLLAATATMATIKPQQKKLSKQARRRYANKLKNYQRKQQQEKNNE